MVNKLEKERNIQHHMRAQWRHGEKDHWEQFFKRVYNTKANCFKNESFVELCGIMNIEIDSLIPRKVEDFSFTVDGRKVDEMVAKARYVHYMNKRYQALAILSMRYNDFQSGN